MTHFLRNKARERDGFTLVELLVVIAIIGILASITVPNIVGFLLKGKNAAAIAEIRSAEMSLSAMLADAEASSFRSFLIDPNYVANFVTQGNPAAFDILNLDHVLAAQHIYNEMFYTLLRQGRNARLGYIKQEVRTKLAESYMDLELDPWGSSYFFWMGPQRGSPVVLHRMYRVDVQGEVYYWNQDHHDTDQLKVPGQPHWDDLPGKPAPREKRVYIISAGANELIDSFLPISQIYNQDDEFMGGGDDITSFDSERGWESAPNS